MAELIDYFKTNGGRIILYTLITKIGPVEKLKPSVGRVFYYFRIHTDGIGAAWTRQGEYFTSCYRTEFEAKVMQVALESRLKRYRRFYR